MIDVYFANVLAGYVDPESIVIERRLGERAICRLTIVDERTTPLRPAIGTLLEVQDTTSAGTEFYGYVLSTSEVPLTAAGGARIEVTAADLTYIADGRLVTMSWAVGADLADVLDDLRVAYLSAYVSATYYSATAYALPALAFVNAPLTDVLNQVCGYGKWRWWFVGTEFHAYPIAEAAAAPADLTDTNRLALAGTLSLSSDRTVYRNRQYVIYGGTGVRDEVDSWVATAAQTNFPLHYTGIVGYRVATVSGIFTPVGVNGVDAMAWTYKASTNELIASSGQSAGTTVSFDISVQCPQTAMAEDAAEVTANGAREVASVYPDIADYPSALATAEALVEQFAMTTPRQVTFDVSPHVALATPFDIGQVLTVNMPLRGISTDTDFLVTEVSLRDLENETFRWTITAVEGVSPQGGWADLYQGMSAGGGGGSAASGSNQIVVINQPVSPSQVVLTSTGSGTKNDFAIGSGTRLLRMSSTGNVTFTGWDEGSVGREVVTENLSTAVVAFSHESTSSVIDNRFDMPSSFGQVLGPGGSARVAYDIASQRWRVACLDPGAWISPAYASTDFTASGSMTWTVSSGDVMTRAYRQHGKQSCVALYLTDTSVGGTPNTALQVALPAGMTATRTMTAPALVNDNGTAGAGLVHVSSGASVVSLVRWPVANWTASTNATQAIGELTFEID